MRQRFSQLALLVVALVAHVNGFLAPHRSWMRPPTHLAMMKVDSSSRRLLLQSTLAAALVAPVPALAATRPPLDALLYNILRVREACGQEMRLIQSGKFKDVQRANVKLAIRFMLENYRLSDTFVAASAYLDGNERRVTAGQVGQAAVQNLYTILEYFDSSDVQNIKVNEMAGKEELVMKGLEAARRSLDEFLAFFPTKEVDAVKAKVAQENELNIKEFDSALGTIVNLPTP